MPVQRAFVLHAAAKGAAPGGGAQRPRGRPARPALGPPPAGRASKSGVASAKKEAQSGAVLASEPRAAPQEASEVPAGELDLSLVRPPGGSRFKLRVEPHTRTLGDFLLNLLRQRVRKARKLQKSVVRVALFSQQAVALYRDAPTWRACLLRRFLGVKHHGKSATWTWELRAASEPPSPGADYAHSPSQAQPETRDAATDDDAVRELRLVLRRLRNTLTCVWRRPFVPSPESRDGG